jgi:RNA polymerase sigma-70 factor, ECF subfamily
MTSGSDCAVVGASLNDPNHENVTDLLIELSSSRPDLVGVRDRLYAAVYDELRRAAGAIMRTEDPAHILQPTALVNEAYLKLVNDRRVEWRDRVHFMAVATRAMRQVLVDYARQRDAAKRGGCLQRVTLDEAVGAAHSTLGIIEIDAAIERLTALNDRMGRVVELRVFGGLTHPEIAEALSVSARTVRNDWSVARRWLVRELDGTSAT